MLMQRLRLKNRLDGYLVGILALAGFLYGYGIWDEVYSNAYYTAAVQSMLHSWKAFWYAGFDSAGFITVDKPPVGLWFQALSAKVFGLHGWSVILPSVVAAMGSIWLLYRMVKPAFGLVAARVAALVLAVTPITVAVTHTNNLDSSLVFVLMLASAVLTKAVRVGKLRFVLLAFALVGVAFNIKMLQAFMVLPAFYFFYWVASQATWQKRILHLIYATLVVAVVSLSWAVSVDLTPKNERPYIGSSGTNSVLSLAFGYNGIQRLTGQQSMGSNRPNVNFERWNIHGRPMMGEMPQGGQQMWPPPGGMQNRGTFGPRNDGAGGAFGTNGLFNTGTPSVVRLFVDPLASQASWLLSFGLIGAISLLSGVRLRRKWTDQEAVAGFFLVWLLPMAAFFSKAEFMHEYYLTMLGPGIAGLVGASWVRLWDRFKAGADWQRWLLPLAFVITMALEVHYIFPYRADFGLLWYVLLIVAAVVLLRFLVIKGMSQAWVKISTLLVLLAAPFYWSTTPLTTSTNTVMPAAGFTNQQMGGIGNEQISQPVISYLLEHQGNATYLFATNSATSAAPYVIQSGKAVMALGGFNGGDKAISLTAFKQLVADGKVKYYMAGGMGGPNRGGSDIASWVQENGTLVDASALGGANVSLYLLK
jgi:4-amino-4-deoxy-L-arabinose transferase-like glycosyltransferase